MAAIVCFLQNQWFKDPVRMEAMLRTTFKGNREKFIRTWLFYSCMTGQRLRKVFGEEFCDSESTIWEEASDKMGGYAASAYPADQLHIARVIEKHRPRVVLAFGKIASVALEAMPDKSFKLFVGPHPVARGVDTMLRLYQMKDKLLTMTCV